jgi:hypothetical protein
MQQGLLLLAMLLLSHSRVAMLTGLQKLLMSNSGKLIVPL